MAELTTERNDCLEALHQAEPLVQEYGQQLASFAGGVVHPLNGRATGPQPTSASCGNYSPTFLVRPGRAHQNALLTTVSITTLSRNSSHMLSTCGTGRHTWLDPHSADRCCNPRAKHLVIYGPDAQPQPVTARSRTSLEQPGVGSRSPAPGRAGGI